jgi:hypothetical protein
LTTEREEKVCYRIWKSGEYISIEKEAKIAGYGAARNITTEEYSAMMG